MGLWWSMFVPKTAIFTALISGVSTAVFFLLLSHRPFKISALGSRFQLSIVIGFILWIILCHMSGVFIEINFESILDIAGGLFFFATAIIAFWNIWSLIAYSFRFNILLNLTDQEKPISTAKLLNNYSDGQGLGPVLDGRLGLLLRLGMVELIGDQISLTTGWGTFMAYIMKIFMSFWGLRGNL